MTNRTGTGDLRSALRALFPEVARETDAKELARQAQAARLSAIAKQLARDRVPPTKATGSLGCNAGGQALQIDRHPDGSINPRGLDSSGRDWSVRIAADAVEPTSINHWKTPPPAEAPIPLRFPDLAGQTFGQLVVLRYHRSHRKLGAQWLVRCVCGDYELRTTKALRSVGPEHGCGECGHLQHLRWIARENAERPGDTANLFDKLAADARKKKSPGP